MCDLSVFHLQHGVTAVGCAKFRDSLVGSVGGYCSPERCVSLVLLFRLAAVV